MCVVMSLLSSGFLLSTPPPYHFMTDTATSLFHALQFNRPTTSTHNCTQKRKQFVSIYQRNTTDTKANKITPQSSTVWWRPEFQLRDHCPPEIRHRYLFCNLETRGDKVLASPAPLCRLVSGRGGIVVVVHNPGYNGKSPKRSLRQWGQLCVGRLSCHHLSENANYLIPWR